MRDETGTKTELICMPKEGLMPAPFNFALPIPISPQDWGLSVVAVHNFYRPNRACAPSIFFP